jgi:hypothetical protein
MTGMRIFWHAYANTPRWHVRRDCDAIAETPDERIASASVSRLRAVARRGGGRPCRMCALEPVLGDLLTHPVGNRPARMACAAHGLDVASPWAAPSESAASRLTGLAGRFGWTVISSAAGPIAYATVQRPVAVAVAANLRCMWDAADGPLDGEVAAAVWSLAGQFHGAAAGSLQDRELWRIAGALCS